MPNLVPHPETGQPSLEVTTHEVVELSQLEGKVTEAEAALGLAQAETTRLQAELTNAQEASSAAEVALADAKSLVDQYHAILPADVSGSETPDAGAEGTSSDSENGSTEAPADAVDVPVTVEEPVQGEF